MPLIIPNEGATQEEINSWIIETQEKYNNMETELEQKTKREKELMEHNQKLFLRITHQKEDKKKVDENFESKLLGEYAKVLDENELEMLRELEEEL